MTYSPAHQQRAHYQRQQILTAPKEKLVQLLFDGVVRFCEQSKLAFSAEPIRLEEGCQGILRAQAIIMELLYSIDREQGGEVAENLSRLHAYAFKCLIDANVRRNVEKLEEVQGIYRSLSDAWIGAMGQLRESDAAPETAAPQATPKPQAIPTPAPVPNPAAATQAIPARPAAYSAPRPAAIPAPALQPSVPAVATPATAPAAMLRPMATGYGPAVRPLGGLARPAGVSSAPATTPVPAVAAREATPAPSATTPEAVTTTRFEQSGTALSQQMHALRTTLSGGGATTTPAQMAARMAGASSYTNQPRRAMAAAAYRAAVPTAN